ncbi:MAG: BatD family protein [Saprospiraceae bacterium]
MKKYIIFSLLTIFGLTSDLNAQSDKSPVFKVQIDRDTVLMGNYFKVTFELENAKGVNFEMPTFDNFDIVGGPNQSSSFSMINGDVSQKVTYTFFLKPKMEGSYFIEPASIEVDGGVMETLPLEVNVYPNPDGIVQEEKPKMDERMDFFFRGREGQPLPQPEKPKKEKRKTYKL